MFKPGDKVKCIDDFGSGLELTQGQIYTIRSYRGDAFDEVYLEGVRMSWLVTRFEKVNEMKTTINGKAKPKAKAKPSAEAYYVRHKPSGHGVSLAASQSSSVQVPATMIATYEDAVNEANRLAELHAGSEFVILGVVYKVKKVPVYTTEAQEYSV